MEGGGEYNRNSSVQAAGMSQAIPLFQHSAERVLLAPAPEPVVIADYGSSEGRNSLASITAAIRALRSRAGPGRAISVVHTDLPNNDFAALFRTLSDSPDSYVRGGAIFPSAIGQSFYEQILPSNSVTLGWSSWAVQWLSRTPAPIPDHVYPDATTDAVTRTAYDNQAADDWRTFLTHRDRELRDGGRLVVMTMASIDDGDFGLRPLMRAMIDVLTGLVKEGFISDDERRLMAIPIVGRRKVDFLAPFAERGQFAKLAVEYAELFVNEDHFWGEFERDHDASNFGARWAAFSRASVSPTLALGLKSRQKERVVEFYNRLEAGITIRLAEAPEPMRVPLVCIVMTKGSVS
jgi:SAM dependent carboxyl methyltransferase